MKIFKWFVELKIKRLDGKDRIIYLTNKLIKEINGQGHSIMDTQIASGFGNIDIWLHNYGKDNQELKVEKMKEFTFIGKPENGIR